jgi:hypothetical protein
VLVKHLQAQWLGEHVGTIPPRLGEDQLHNVIANLLLKPGQLESDVLHSADSSA